MIYKYIELFGVSGSGKSYIRNEIKKLLSKSNIKILDNRELIVSEYKKIIKLDFTEKQIINYFKILKIIKKKKKLEIKNPKIYKKELRNNRSVNFLKAITINIKKKYEKICIKILLKNKKSKNIYEFFLKILKKNSFKNKDVYCFWFVENLAAYSIYEKIKNKSNFIYFPDEGFIQRTFLINHLIKPKNVNIIKRYLEIIPKAKLILNINSKKEKIYNSHSLRKLNNSEFIMNKKEINKMIKFKKKFVKDYANFNFKTIKNNSNLKKVLNNYFNY